jgi:ABC-type dipeptide/oligopeptide/nickel transport system permease subunit
MDKQQHQKTIIAIMLLVLTFILIGNALREALDVKN